MSIVEILEPWHGAENTRKQYPMMKKEPLKTGDFKLYSRRKYNSRAIIASVSD